MKILLVEADFKRYADGEKNFHKKPSAPTLGVNYLASILRNHGHNVIVLDSLYEYLRNGFSNPIDIIHGTNDILEKEKDIECVGISITSPTRNYAIKIAKNIKKYDPRIKVIAGGPHITIMRELFIQRFSQLFDFIVVSEGDITFLELINSLESEGSLDNIAGIAYKNSKGAIKKISPRASLTNCELNDTSIVPFTNYSHYQNILPGGVVPAITLVTTRGCPYKCNFCYSPFLWQKYRIQSSKRVLEEIKYHVETHGVRNIRFQDDTFTYDKDRCLDIFKGIKYNKWHLELYMHTRFDCIDEDIIKLYSEAGGKDICFGLESGSENIRSAMSKNASISNKKITEICEIAKDYGLNLGLWLMFGYPGETLRDIQITYEFLNKIRPDEVSCNPVHVHPNTPLFFQALDQGIYKLDDWLNCESDFFPYNKGLTGQYVFSLCDIMSKFYSKKDIQIRRNIEKDIETTWGDND